jgi:hypothetical protein
MYKISCICTAIFCLIVKVEAFQIVDNAGALHFTYEKMPEVLPGTKPLLMEGDLSAKMLDGAHKFIEGKINSSIANRLKLWNRDFTSRQAYELSVEPNRKRFMKYIGLEDKTQPLVNYNVGIADKRPEVFMQRFSTNNDRNLWLRQRNTGYTRFGGRC